MGLSGVRRAGVAAAVLLALSSAGCGASSEQQAAETAATRFVSLRAAEPAAACALLAPTTIESLEKSAGQACPDALTVADIPDGTTVRAVTVDGHSALVVLADQRVFLARFDDGWRVIAAGCRRDSTDTSVPADCEIKG